MKGAKKILVFILIVLLMLTGISIAISDNISEQITSTNQTIAESFDSTDETSIHQKIEETSANFALAPLNPEFLEYQNRTASKDVLLYVEMSDDGHALGLIPHPVDLSHLGDIDVALVYLGYLDSYDLRSQGRVTSVRDQGGAGSCWAHATYASLESYLLPAETWNFSENNMKNLLSSSYSEGFDREHDDGGNHFMSTAYLARWGGPINESDDSYNPASGVSPLGLNATKHVQDVLFVPDRDNSSDNDNIKWAIENYGAVYSTMRWNNSDYNGVNYTYYYDDGTYDGYHAIAIVGWNDSFDKNKFSTIPPGNGAFIIKNSWGTGWGENGYFYVSYCDSVIGNDTAIFTAEALNNYDYVYQYDPLGWAGSCGYSVVTAWAANIFAAESYESLEAVSFYTTDSDVKYELYIYTDPISGPINTTGPIGTKTGTISLAGYHTIPLDSSISINTGQNFSVVVKFTNPSYIYPIAIERPLAYYYSSKATANAEEGYCSSDGTTWTDITATFENTSICIKAFTTKENTLPNASGEVPINGSLISNTTPLISVNITDNASGVNVSSIVMTVNGSIVEISNIPIPGGYRVYNQTAAPFADDQLINVSVSAFDNASNSMTYNWSFTIDATPPTSNTPSNTEFSANTTASFDKWILTDLHPGYYWVLRNATEIVHPTAWDNSTNITVSIDTNISLGDFNYTIQYNDSVGNNGTQNSVIITINDTAPPYASGEVPANNTSASDNTPLISVNITDNASGVNPDSIVMKVNGSTVTPKITPIAGGYNVSNQTITPFSHIQVVNVTVNATDNNSNILNFSWSFNVDGDAPIVINPDATPVTIESNGTDTTNLSVFATDSFSGINSVSINLSTIGGSATAKMTNSSGTYWIITNATGAVNDTYSLPVNATDNAGNSNTSVSITLYVNDTTKPILSDNTPLSGTNYTAPTISINATDKGSGINTSSANMTVNDVQVLLVNTSSGFTFNFTNTTAAYNHGDTVNVTFNVSDNEGHTTNTSWMFYIDTAAPTIAITSPADGYSTTASSITVTGTVNGTGSPPTMKVNGVTAANTTNNTVFNGTFSATASLNVGQNTIYANVTDAAGNTTSTHINVTRTTSTTTSSGGGGGGGGTSGEDFNNIAETQTRRVSIFKGDNVSYSFENTVNPIININFTAKVSAGKVASKIEVLRNTSTMVDTPAPGRVYKNINIWVGNYGWATENNIGDMTISFTVPLDWITSNNIDKGSIALYRYNDDSWERLPTSWTSRNENSITFTSSTPGFSPFAISGETVSTPAVIPIAHNTTPATVATHSSNITSTPQTNEIEPWNKEGTIMLWVLFIIIILAVTVIIYQRKDEILQGINNMRQQRGR